jgi:hypothetical protein
MVHADFDRIKRLISEMDADFPKFFGRKNQSAGLRIRRKMQEVRELAQKIRLEVLAKNSRKRAMTRPK